MSNNEHAKELIRQLINSYKENTAHWVDAGFFRIVDEKYLYESLLDIPDLSINKIDLRRLVWKRVNWFGKYFYAVLSFIMYDSFEICEVDGKTYVLEWESSVRGVVVEDKEQHADLLRIVYASEQIGTERNSGEKVCQLQETMKFFF